MPAVGDITFEVGGGIPTPLREAVGRPGTFLGRRCSCHTGVPELPPSRGSGQHADASTYVALGRPIDTQHIDRPEDEEDGRSLQVSVRGVVGSPYGSNGFASLAFCTFGSSSGQKRSAGPGFSPAVLFGTQQTLLVIDSVDSNDLVSTRRRSLARHNHIYRESYPMSNTDQFGEQVCPR